GDLTSQQKAVEEYLETIARARGNGTIDAIRWHQILSRVSRLTEIPVEQLNRRFKNVKARPAPVASRSDESESAKPQATKPTAASVPASAKERAERWILGSLLLHP